jgi:hypothetical protein
LLFLVILKQVVAETLVKEEDDEGQEIAEIPSNVYRERQQFTAVEVSLVIHHRPPVDMMEGHTSRGAHKGCRW